MKRTYVFAILGTILVTMVLLPCSVPTRADATSGRIYGYTYQSDGWNLYPVALVQVTTGSYQTYSNILGYYEINNLPLGTYQVAASKMGYNNITVQVQLTAENANVNIDFILSLHAQMSQKAEESNIVISSLNIAVR